MRAARIFCAPLTPPPLPTRRLTPQSTHRDSGRPSNQIPRSLTALAEVAAVLATGETVAADFQRVLSVLCEELQAVGAVLWLEGERAVRVAATAGDSALLAQRWEEIAAALEAPEFEVPDIAFGQLVAGGRRLGVIALSTDGGLSAEQQMLLSSVADLLAPVLRAAAHTQELESLVAVRTQELEAQRRFIGSIIDSLPLGLYVIDREYRIQAWNRKRETGTQGVSREEALGRTIFEILHRQPAELLRSEFDEVFHTGTIQQFQMESQVTGELRTYRLSKIPMRLVPNEVTHVITIGEDVTEWRAAQDRFAQAEKLAAIGTLAAGVMHEINNPLATIGACAESLAIRIAEGAPMEDLVDELREALRVIEMEVQRCKGIVESLLDFSRPKAATKQPLDLDGVIERTIFLLKHHSRFKRLSVNAELSHALPAVEGSEEQLVQVFMALLLNAMDAMEGHGTVTLRTRTDESSGTVVAEVIDEGTGIRGAELQKIFEPFYTTKPPGRGTGLGLSICYSIVAEHGGRIEVDSAPGTGSVFRIVLPILTTSTTSA